MVQDIVAATGHVIDNSVSIDSHTSCSASLDHITELIARTTTTLELIGSGLIVPPPGVEFTVLRPFEGECRLSDWVNFDAHPALFAQVFALLSYISVRPAKHFDDATFLTIFIDSVLVDLISLPDKVDRLEGDLVIAVAVVGLDLKAKLIGE